MMDKNRYCVIMAGGVGSRFWPVSRRAKPKQFLDILGTGKSFLRHTYERFAQVIPAENFLVATNAIYKEQVLEHLPELKPEQVLCEPVGRNTAPCIAYAAWRLKAMNAEATMIVTPADHLILNEREFAEVVCEGATFVEKHPTLMTIGIQPSRPDTGYGYIQKEQGSESESPSISKVKTFTEKPNLELAQTFVESGEFFWNSGIFIWKVSTIMESFDEFQPDIQLHFRTMADKFNTPDEQMAIEKIYPECRNISIDYGVMEKAGNVYVRCSDFGWSDIGTWGSLYQHSDKDDQQNFVNGLCRSYNTTGSILIAPEGKLVVADSLEDFIVVDTQDVLMICPRDREQAIREFVEDVKLSMEGEYI